MKLNPTLSDYYEKLPPFMKDLNKVEKFVKNLEFELTDEQSDEILFECFMVLSGVKFYGYLPSFLVENAKVSEQNALSISQLFLDNILKPIEYKFMTMILKIYSGESDISYDPDEALLIEQFLQNNEIESLEDYSDNLPVPKPPKFVSPKLTATQSAAAARIENIRPKPHQGSDDPYREEF